jgi:two-component system response regulator PilR (NtrC family)
LQAKLLRVLQERRVVPVGDAIPRPVDMRVICATHRNLAEMVQAGTFRQDLFFRLQVFTLLLPPLRDRVDDIPQLADFFLERLAELGGDIQKKLSDEAVESLMNHSWPGNVRELFNVLEHAWVLADGNVIGLSDLPAPLSTGGYRAYHPSDLNLEAMERRVIIEALKRSQYNRTAACKLLGLELRRLNRRITSLKIELPKRSVHASKESRSL